MLSRAVISNLLGLLVLLAAAGGSGSPEVQSVNLQGDAMDNPQWVESIDSIEDA